MHTLFIVHFIISRSNIVVREQIPEEIVISFMDPVAVLGLSASEAVNEVARIAREKLQKVLGKLAEIQNQRELVSSY